MSANELEELGVPTHVESEPVSQEQEAAPPAETPDPERPRDEQGRFAPRAQAQPDEQATAQEPQPAEEGYVPVSALQKVRQEAQAYKRRLAELEQRQQQQPQQPQQDLPPEQQAAWAYQNDRLNTFEEIARTQYGDDVVDQAQDWFREVSQADPYAAQAILSARNPYRELIEQFSADLRARQIAQLMTEQGFDPFKADEWAVERARALAAQQQQQAAAQSQPRQAPPRSINSAPATGGATSTPIGPGQAFDSTFNR